MPVSPVTFIPFDPANTSPRQLSLLRARALSHSAGYVHRRRRCARPRSVAQSSRDETTVQENDTMVHAVVGGLSIPAMLVLASSDRIKWDQGRDERQQAYSIQFFIDKTAVEWSGYYDHHFWQKHVLQAAVSYTYLRHGLVALGACHQALELRSNDPAQSTALQRYSLAHARKTISGLTKQHGRIPVSVWLLSCMVVAVVSGFVQPMAYLTSLQMQLSLRERLLVAIRRGDLNGSEREYIVNYLDPMLARQHSKLAMIIDMQTVLRQTPAAHFFSPYNLSVPYEFMSLEDACASLEHLLNKMTYQFKMAGTISEVDPGGLQDLFHSWTAALNRYEAHSDISERGHLSVASMRISAKLYANLIRTMNAEDETIFDQFTPDYRELAQVFSSITAHYKRTTRATTNFGFTSSIGFICANAGVRWCRDPIIRRQLVQTMYASNQREGLDNSQVAAMCMDLVQHIEEQGINPPPTSCKDIPAQNRVRINSVNTYFKSKPMRIELLRYPYRLSDVESHWITHPGSGAYLQTQDMLESLRADDEPDIVFGRGWAQIHNPESAQRYIFKDSPFYFSVPRV
jgi:hypothetical protein